MSGNAVAKSPTSGDGASTITAEAIAALVSGELIGDGKASVTGVAPLDRAEGNHISILSSAKYEPMLANTRAGIVLIDPEFRDAPGEPAARIIVEQAARKTSLAASAIVSGDAAASLESRQPPALGEARCWVRESRSASTRSSAPMQRSATTSWSARTASLGRVRVSGMARALAARHDLPRANLGARAIIHSGASVGSDGFGYVFRDGAHQKIPHVGRCIVGDDVEIGANTTVDRGSIDDTVIGNGTKIDNLVHIAHNVRIGQKCLIMAQVGIAGSVTVGDGAILGGPGRHQRASSRLAPARGSRRRPACLETYRPARRGRVIRPARIANHFALQAALFKLAGMMRGLEKLLAGAETK